MRLAIVAAAMAFGLLAVPAKAGEPNFTISQLLELSSGLQQLDGYDRVVKVGDAERVIREPYKLGGAARLAIARCITALKPAVENFNNARTGLINEISGGLGKIDPNTPQSAKFAIEIEKLGTTKEAISCPGIKADALNLDVNPIPGTVLSALMPIME